MLSAANAKSVGVSSANRHSVQSPLTASNKGLLVSTLLWLVFSGKHKSSGYSLLLLLLLQYLYESTSLLADNCNGSAFHCSLVKRLRPYMK